MHRSVPPFVGVSVHVTTVFGSQPPLRPKHPVIGKPFFGFEEQDLAINDAVPMRHRRSSEVEPVANERLEVVPHQPLLDQRA
jgi:hypothetical protein